ncbi:TNF receptor-associated factor 4-like [Dysidea avara]|uniref:TNF receptor-associated factor 4-like n=1 Tax=Dysidea avara TaxID=196820 RepID=UPI00332FE058
MAIVPTDIGGYDCTFVDAVPDRLVCKICDHPSRDPRMSVCCGHNFCKSCLENASKATGITKSCPICRARNDKFITFPNKQADRELKGLQITCPNKENGCKWQGELNHVSNHLKDSDTKGCRHENVKCTNTGCEEVVQRRSLQSHVVNHCPHRWTFCKHCFNFNKYKFIIGEHKDRCPKLPIPCPNKCKTDNVLREDMEAHRKECPLEVIQCEYHNIGCEESMMRKNKRKHEEEHMEEHLSMTKAKLSKTEDRLSVLEKMFDTFISKGKELAGDRMITSGHSSIHLATLSALTCPVTVKMSRYSHYKSSGAGWYSDPFYSHNKGYKMCLLVNADGQANGKHTHMSVFLFLMKGQCDDELSWPLRGKFEIKLLNQLSDHEHHTNIVTYGDFTSDRQACRVTDKTMGTILGNGNTQFISNTNLHKITPTCQYLKDKCIFFKVNKL